MKWDLFISHASEDKEAFARPLAFALKERHIKVWFDEFTLTIGDSLRRSIDRGLADSRFGVVVISKHFLSKEWPQKELDGLTAREVGGTKVILPIWHGIRSDEIRQYSPLLADRLAVSSDAGLDKVILEIIRVLGKSEQTEDREEELGVAIKTNMVSGLASQTSLTPVPAVDRWRIGSGKLVREIQLEQLATRPKHHKRLITITDDGRRVVSCVEHIMGWTIRFWDIETGDLIADVLLDNFTRGDGLVLLFDGELMIIGDVVIHGPCSEATTRLSHVKHWKEWVVGRVACLTPHKSGLFSRNGRFVAINDYDPRRIAIHDLGVIDWSKPSADTIRSDFPIFIAKLFQTIDLDTEEYAWPGAFSSDGTRLVMRTREGMTIWDVMTGKRVSTFPAGMPAAFSPDGTRIATGGRFLKVWNADSGLPAFIFTERGAAFVGGMGWISRKWYSALDRSRDLAEGARVIKPTWHFAVNAVAFSCDGTLIAAPAGDKLRIINASTAQLLATLEIGAEQESCTFSVNGARIVLRRGNYVQVWEP